jgi:hypothetical protein
MTVVTSPIDSPAASPDSIELSAPSSKFTASEIASRAFPGQRTAGGSPP